MESPVIIPDYEVFETAHIARSSMDEENTCIRFFKLAWGHYIDGREKIVVIPKELEEELVKKNYKSSKNKRQALFSVVRAYDKPLGNESDFCVSRLASRMAFNQDSDVYLVIGSEDKRKAIGKILKEKISIIGPKEACRVIEENMPAPPPIPKIN